PQPRRVRRDVGSHAERAQQVRAEEKRRQLAARERVAQAFRGDAIDAAAPQQADEMAVRRVEHRVAALPGHDDRRARAEETDQIDEGGTEGRVDRLEAATAVESTPPLSEIATRSAARSATARSNTARNSSTASSSEILRGASATGTDQ